MCCIERKIESFLSIEREIESFLSIERKIESFLSIERKIESFLSIERKIESLLCIRERDGYRNGSKWENTCLWFDRQSGRTYTVACNSQHIGTG